MDKKEMVNAINEAIYKAMEDDNFKAKLLKDANEAVLELTGKKIPVKVTIHDSDEKNLVFILPKWNPEGELNEDNLETVSGGALPNTLIDISKICYYHSGYAAPFILKPDKIKLDKINNKED